MVDLAQGGVVGMQTLVCQKPETGEGAVGVVVAAAHLVAVLTMASDLSGLAQPGSTVGQAALLRPDVFMALRGAAAVVAAPALAADCLLKAGA
jgi:hypothetical protein